MGKWLNRIKEKTSGSALQQGDIVDTVSNKSTMSTLSLHTSHTIKKNPYIDACKIGELRRLINQISINCGGDDEHFLDEYINDIIMSNDIDATLVCFRDLAKQIPPVKNRE